MTVESFLAPLAIVGLVIGVSTLLSGAIERSRLPSAAAFLLLGLLLGPYGLAVLDVTIASPILRVVATLSLALVLFVDAVGLDLVEIRPHLGLVLRVLGPGTLLSTAAIALAGWLLLGLGPAEAAILGAALASTDPVLLRAFLNRRDLPEDVRVALRVESGLNDVVLLPIVLIAMAVLAHGRPDWPRVALELFVLGPAAGAVVAFVAISALEIARRRTGIQRDYESLYSLGVAFTAFAAGEALHGSGFLAAFTAGLTVAALDVALCDCFAEYGETTAEMALLFTFVLLGASLLWTGFQILDGRTVAFALVALAIRPLVMLPSLMGSRMARGPRLLVAWFGPRGLSSLLLVLLPVFADVPGAWRLFQACSLVVILSVVVHGATMMLVGRRAADRLRAPLPTPRPAPPPTEPPTGDKGERITLDELRAWQDRGEQVVIADARTHRSARGSALQAAGAVRLAPRHAVEDATALAIPRDALVALYCA